MSEEGRKLVTETIALLQERKFELDRLAQEQLNNADLRAGYEDGTLSVGLEAARQVLGRAFCAATDRRKKKGR